MKIKNYFLLLVITIVLSVGAFIAGSHFVSGSFVAAGSRERFDILAKSGNSSCSTDFSSSIKNMPDGNRLRGSCCSAMDFERYTKQVAGLKKYKNISEIPPDPYDIEAGLAKKLMGYYDMQLTPEEQKTYDYAMENSEEKGPCCCQCWRWYVYGGLAKHLIKDKGFTGEQITEIWNLSDGCGGGD